jgi:hypothetical protein
VMASRFGSAIRISHERFWVLDQVRHRRFEEFFGCRVMAMKSKVFDREHHMLPIEFLMLRYPKGFVQCPRRENPNPYEWEAWAREVVSHYDLAKQIVDLADSKKRKKK